MNDSGARLEATGPLTSRLTLTLDPERVSARTDDRLKALRRTVSVPGFRPGRAPFGVLKKRYGARVRREQAEREAQAVVRRELAERGLVPAVPPRIELEEDESVQAEIEVFPELPPIAIAELSIERPLVEITDADVDRMIEQIRAENKDAKSESIDFRDEVRATMEEELAEALGEEIAYHVEAKLIEALPDLELPTSLLEAQLEGPSGAASGESTELALEIETEARRRLTAALALAQTARQLGIQPDPTELWRETERIAARADNRQEEMDRLWGDQELIQAIEDRLLRRKVAEAALCVARVVEVPMTFTELAKARRERSR